MIGIQFHEFECSRQRAVFQEPYRHRALCDEFSKPVRPYTLGLEHVKRFREHRHGSTQRLANGLQNTDAARMMMVLSVEQRHERPRIDENHRPCFLLSARRTQPRVSADEVIARPPGPKSNSL